MQIFTANTGAPQQITELQQNGIGVMISSCYGTRIRPYHQTVKCSLDNGAFAAWQKHYGFDEYLFLKTLSDCIRKGIHLEFIIAPDIVAGGMESLEFSLAWQKRLVGHSLYLAVQNGMTPANIKSHMKGWEGIFVGGTLDWKIAKGSQWVEFAHSLGIKCHIGRCGTVDRLRWAEQIGADSVDSTNFVRDNTIRLCSTYQRQLKLAI